MCFLSISFLTIQSKNTVLNSKIQRECFQYVIPPDTSYIALGVGIFFFQLPRLKPFRRDACAAHWIWLAKFIKEASSLSSLPI